MLIRNQEQGYFNHEILNYKFVHKRAQLKSGVLGGESLISKNTKVYESIRMVGMGNSFRIATNPFYARRIYICLLCQWATRELGMTTIKLSQKLKLSQPTISQSAKRGQEIVQELGLCLIEKGNQ